MIDLPDPANFSNKMFFCGIHKLEKICKILSLLLPKKQTEQILDSQEAALAKPCFKPEQDQQHRQHNHNFKNIISSLSQTSSWYIMIMLLRYTILVRYFYLNIMISQYHYSYRIIHTIQKEYAAIVSQHYLPPLAGAAPGRPDPGPPPRREAPTSRREIPPRARGEESQDKAIAILFTSSDEKNIV